VSLLDDITARGAEVRTRLCELQPNRAYPSDHKTVWLLGSVEIALEHHQSIWLLIERKLTGSAFALLRPLIDTVLRAHWINAVATEQQIEQASDDKDVFPKMSDMRDAVIQAYNADRFFRPLLSEWAAMCSYTHSGAQQIARRFTNGDVKPSYTDGEIAEVLYAATFALLLLMRTFFMSVGNQQAEADEVEALHAQFINEFIERLHAAAKAAKPTMNPP
jgi:hypothetical protein